jgi:hypothetical protein
MASTTVAEFALLHKELSDAWKAADRLTHEPLRPVVWAFLRNLQRIDAVSRFPFLLIGISTSIWELRSQACVEILGRPVFDSSRDAEHAAKLNSRLAELLRAREDTKPDDPRNLMQSDYIFHVVSTADGTVRTAFEAILSTMLLDTWMAYESLSTDLWINAVNLRPKALVRNFTKAQSKGSQEKSVPITALMDRDFNVQACMGRFLHDTGKVDFSSLRNTQMEYRRAFGDDADDVFNDERLRILELIRNLLAHRGGIVDEQFVRDTRDTKELDQLASGQPLKIDVPMVRKFVGAGVTRAVRVLRYVETWLNEHPDE